MTARPGREPQRFRVVVEGVTRFVGESGDAADVTLTMPTSFRNEHGNPTREIMLGAMSLDGVEWLPEPLKRGDVLHDGDPEPPIGSAIFKVGDSGYVHIAKRHRHGWAIANGSNSSSWDLLIRAWHTAEVVHVGNGEPQW